MNIFEWIYLGLMVLLVLICILMLVKNEVTFRNHRLISNAIFLYTMDCIDKAYKEARETGKDYDECCKCEVDYDDMEDYNNTLYRLWDWGYTRILPPEKFEIIKPYIEQAKEECK